MSTKLQKKSYRQVLFEAFIPNLDKCLLVYQHLKDNYTREFMDDISEDGGLTKSVSIGIKKNGNVVNFITPNELLLRLDTQFNGIVSDAEDKKKFLKQVIADWVNGKIGADGTLSKNSL